MSATTSPHGAGRIGRNALSGIGARAATMLIGFLLTPLIVHAVGLTTFGLWSILASVVGYVGMLDFGLGGAFVKYVSEYAERGRTAAVRDVVSFGMTFYAAFGAVLAVPFFLLTPALLHLFKMPAGETAQAVWLFRALFVLLIASLAFGLPGSMVVALHRMDLANRNMVVGYLAYALFTAAALLAGWGIRGLVVAGFVQLIVTTALQYSSARALFGGRIWSSPSDWDRAVVGQLFRFGGWMQLTSLFSIASLDVGRFVTAALVGVTHVAYYELGGKLSYLTLSVPGNFLSALVPAAAAADARSDHATLTRMYRSGTLYVCFATVAIGGFLAGAAGPIVHVWMGQRLPYVEPIVAILVAGYVLGSLAEIGRTLLRAMGAPQYETLFAAIAGALSLVLAIVLAARSGVVGAALGSSLGWIGGSVVFIVLFHRRQRIAFWSTVGIPAARLLGAGALATLGLAAVVHTSAITALFAGRLVGALTLAAAGSLYLVAFAGLAWLFGVERFDDARLVPRLRRALETRFVAFAGGTR